jgi:dihydrofolate synthase/folylpolyglutamate synthase
MRNAALACEAVQILSEKLPVSERALLDGIAQMQWPCRMEKVLPDVVIDGAHNEDGIAEFVRAVQYFHRNREITLLFGAVADKRYPDMIRTLAEQIRPERVVVTRVPGDRAVSEDVFAELFRSCGIQNVCSDPEPGQAFALARSLQGDGMLFCVGSLYLAGELKRQLEKKA